MTTEGFEPRPPRPSAPQDQHWPARSAPPDPPSARRLPPADSWPTRTPDQPLAPPRWPAQRPEDRQPNEPWPDRRRPDEQRPNAVPPAGPPPSAGPATPPATSTRYLDPRALREDGRGPDVWSEPKSVRPPTPPRGVEYPRDSAPPRPDVDRPHPGPDRPDTPNGFGGNGFDRPGPPNSLGRNGSDRNGFTGNGVDRPGPVPPSADPASFGAQGFGAQPARPPSAPRRPSGGTGQYPVNGGVADGYWSPPGARRPGPPTPPPPPLSPPVDDRIPPNPAAPSAPGREPGWSTWSEPTPEAPRTEIANVLDGGPEGTQIANVLDGGPGITSAPDRRPSAPPSRRPDLPPGGLGAGPDGAPSATPNGPISTGLTANSRTPNGFPATGAGRTGPPSGFAAAPRQPGEDATELLPTVPGSGPADSTSLLGGPSAPSGGAKYDYYADRDGRPNADGPHQQGLAADGFPADGYPYGDPRHDYPADHFADGDYPEDGYGEDYADDYEGYDDYYDDEPPGAAAGGAGGGRRRVSVLGVVGEIVLTLGVVVLLFVVYEVYWTDLISAGKQKSATNALDQQWQSGDDPLTNDRGNHLNLDGHGFAKLFVPKFGPDWAFTVLQGTDDATLESGPGHYKDTAMPGDPGNFAVAGHRVGKGSPFNDLGYLNSCDSIVIETAHNWFVYRVLPMSNEAAGWAQNRGATDPQCAGVAPLGGVYNKTVGREIVLPTDGDVILPVPNRPDVPTPPATGAARLITLTTCHPQFSDKERMVIHGELVKSYPNDPAHPVAPPELTEPAQNGPAPS